MAGMMPTAGLTDPGTDPSAAVRKRVVGQLDPATPFNGTAPQTPGRQPLSGNIQTQPVGTPQPVASAPLNTPTGGYGAQTNAQGQVTNGINPITGAPLGPNEGGSISTPYNPGPGTSASDGAAGGGTDAHSTVASWMSGNNPQGHQDAAYWERRIAETGGLRPDNMAYWKGRFEEAPGTHVENGGGGGGGGSNSTDPSIAAFYQAQTANLARQQEQQAGTRQIIMDRLKQAGGPVDENASQITQPLSAARDEVARSQDRERSAMAERMYASGQLNSGAMNQYLQQSAEKGAGSLSNLRAGLITHEADAKRSELQNLLQMATSSGDAEQARAIQAQIAALNASVASQGQSNQLAMFGADLNFRTAREGLG